MILSGWQGALTRINTIKISNLTYIDSQISFLDLSQSGDELRPRRFTRGNIESPYPGEIFLVIENSLFERIILKDAFSLFKTQDFLKSTLLFII
jgi:hypothetical protein